MRDGTIRTLIFEFHNSSAAWAQILFTDTDNITLVSKMTVQFFIFRKYKLSESCDCYGMRHICSNRCTKMWNIIIPSILCSTDVNSLQLQSKPFIATTYKFNINFYYYLFFYFLTSYVMLCSGIPISKKKGTWDLCLKCKDIFVFLSEYISLKKIFRIVLMLKKLKGIL